jgi:hypothetical protein
MGSFLPRVADQAHGLGPNQTTAFIGRIREQARPSQTLGDHPGVITDHTLITATSTSHLTAMWNPIMRWMEG